MVTSLFARNYAAAGRRGPPSAPKKENGDNNDKHIHQKACNNKKRPRSKSVKQKSQHGEHQGGKASGQIWNANAAKLDSSRPNKIKLEGGQDIKSGFSWEWTMMATSLFVRNYAAAGRRGPPSASKKKNGDNNDRRIHQQFTKGVPQQKTTTLEVGETRVSKWWTSTFMVG